MTEGRPPLRAIALYGADEWGSACPILRVVGPAAAAGLEVLRGCVWSDNVLHSFSIEAVTGAQLVVIQRDFPRYQAAYAQVMAAVREQNKPVVYELDDLLLEVPPDHPSYDYYLEARGPVLAAVTEADWVTASTPGLAAYLRSLNPNVAVLPNALNEHIWKLKRPESSKAGEPIVIGYVGGHTHAADLAMIAPALVRLVERYGDRIRIQFWSGFPPPSLAGLPQVAWTRLHLLDYAEYAAFMQQQRMDICLAPLRDNLFNRCKSAIKFVEYSALGAAGVYSRLEPYTAVVEPGKNGLLAGDEAEWESALVELIEQPDLRRRLAEQAQATVRDHWRLGQHAPAFASVYQSAASEGASENERPQARAANLALAWQTELLATVRAQAEDVRASNAHAGQVAPLQAEVEHLSKQARTLAEITSSPSYAVMNGLASARRRIMPKGGRAERLLDIGILGFRYWRQAGTRAAARRAGEVLAGRLPGVVGEVAGRLARRGDPYVAWIRANEPDARELARQRQFAAPAHWAKISVVVPVYNPGADVLADTISSVRGQTYANWELCLADGNSDAPGVRQALDAAAASDSRVKVRHLERNLGISGNLNAAVELASGEYIMLLDHDDLLAPNALLEVAQTLGRDPELDLVYFDEDKVAEDGRTRREPWFKPSAWSPDLLFSTNLYMHSVMRRQCVLELGGFDSEMDGAQDWDLALRLVARTRRIAHIPRVLYHWRQVPGSAARDANAKPWAFAAQERLMLAHLQRLATEGARVTFPSLGRVRIHWPNSGRQVAIIIPTKDKLEQLRPCIESILQLTSYPNFVIVLVDTGSTRPETWRYYAELKAKTPRVQIVEAPGEFNYSAANNLGASHASAELLLFLNNDVEVLAPDWMDELVGWAERPEVGIVGAKLVRPGGAIQHAGLVMGLGGHGSHAFDGSPEDTYGPFGSSEWYRNYQAVTGACLMTRRSVFDAVGGFDEAYRIGYGDIEFCLRAGQQGYRIVYTPFARLMHYEGASRGFFNPPADVLRAYWQMSGLVSAGDPYFSANLDYDSRQPAIAPPRQPPREARLGQILVDYELVAGLSHQSLARPGAPPTQFRLAKSAAPVTHRVLLVTHELSQSGAPLVLASLARRLKQAGYEIAVLSPIEGPLRATYEQMDVEVQVDPATLSDARAVMSRLGGAGLVMANTILTWRAVHAARAARVPCLWWIHESQFGQALALRNKGMAAAFGAASVVMFPALSNARLYGAYLRPERQAIVPLGMDWPAAVDGAGRAQPDKFVVVSLASLEPRKGQDVLLDALGHLPPELRARIELYLLGQILDRRYYRRLQKTARQYPGVHILGALPRVDALRHLRGADVIALASRDEVMPMVLLEAMASSKGILATTVGGIPEVVEHGAHAWLVPPDDPVAMAQGLSRLLQDKPLRMRLGGAAQKRYAESFTFDRFVADVSGLIQKMASDRQAAGRTGWHGQRESPGELPEVFRPPESFQPGLQVPASKENGH